MGKRKEQGPGFLVVGAGNVTKGAKGMDGAFAACPSVSSKSQPAFVLLFPLFISHKRPLAQSLCQPVGILCIN